MIITLLSIIILITTLAVFHKQIQTQSKKHASIRIIKYIVVAIVSVFGILSIIFGIGEMSANGLSGLSHIIMFIASCITVYLLLRE